MTLSSNLRATFWVGLVTLIGLIGGVVEAVPLPVLGNGTTQTTVTITGSTPTASLSNNSNTDCSSGFTINPKTTVVWNSSGTVNGAITFNHPTSSKLKLAQNLTLGSSGTLAVEDTTYNTTAINIDGQSYSIVLGADTSFNGTKVQLINSPLTLDGSGGGGNGWHFDVGSAFEGFVPATIGTSLTLKKVLLTGKPAVDSEGVFQIPTVTLNGATIYLSAGGDIDIVCGSGTCTQMTVSDDSYFLGTNNHLQLSSGANFNLTINSGKTLQVDSNNSGLTFEAIDFNAGGGYTFSVTQGNASSTLAFVGTNSGAPCNFYTGSYGINMSSLPGKVTFTGTVNVWNEDYSTGIANGDDNNTGNVNAFNLPAGPNSGSSTANVYGRMYDPNNSTTYIGIDQTNASNIGFLTGSSSTYRTPSGYIIPANTVVTWYDSSGSDMVSDYVTVQSGGTLILAHDMQFVDSGNASAPGWLTSNDGTFTPGSFWAKRTVANGNVDEAYFTGSSGFTILAGEKLTWNDTNAVTGPITLSGDLILSTTLYLNGGSITNTGSGLVTYNGFQIIDQSVTPSLPVICDNETITDVNAVNFGGGGRVNYSTGFEVASGVNVTWNDSTHNMTGPVWVNDGATLSLSQNMPFVATSETSPVNGGAWLTLSGSGALSPADDQVATRTVAHGDGDLSNFTSGFTVYSGETVTWTASDDVDGDIMVESGGTLNWNGSGTVNGNITVDDGTLNVNSNLTLGNGYNISGSTVNYNGGSQVVDPSGDPVLWGDTIDITDVTSVTIGSNSGNDLHTGFSVLNGVTVNWQDNSTNGTGTSHFMTGPITVDSGGTLSLSADLYLGDGGSVVLNGGTLQYNGYKIYDTMNNNLPVIYEDITITDVTSVSFPGDSGDPGNYSGGFEIASGVTVTWEDGSGQVTGEILVNGGTLHLNGENLTLGGGGSITNSSGTVSYNGQDVVDGNGYPVLWKDLTITDVTNVTIAGNSNVDCSDGFTVLNGVTVIWNDSSSSRNVNGLITVNSGGVLSLHHNLTLGSNGSVVDNGTINYNLGGSPHGEIVDGNGYPVIWNTSATTTISNVTQVDIGGNTVDCHTGFTVLSDVTVDWTDSSHSVSGPVTVSGTLSLSSCDMPFIAGSSSSAPGWLILNEGSEFSVSGGHVAKRTVAHIDGDLSYFTTGGFDVLDGEQITWTASDTINGDIGVAGNGTLIWNSSGTVHGNVTVSDGGTLSLSQDMHFSAPGWLTVQGSGTFTLNGHVATRTVSSSDSDLTTGHNFLGGFTVYDGETVTWNDSTDTVTGNIEVQSGGTLIWNAAGAVSGNVTVDDGGTLNLNANMPFSAPGWLSNNGTFNYNSYVATRTVSSGDYDLDNFTDGFTVYDGETVTWNYANTGDYVDGGITVDNYGTLILNTNLYLLTSDSITMDGTLTLNGNEFINETSTLQRIVENANISGISNATDGFVVPSGVTVTVDQDTSMNGEIVVQSGGTLVVAEGQTLTISNPNGLGLLNCGTVTVNGTLDITNSGGTGFRNRSTGTVDVDGGTINIANTGGTGFCNSGSGTVIVEEGGVININTAVDGTGFNNSGTVTVNATSFIIVLNSGTYTGSGSVTKANGSSQFGYQLASVIVTNDGSDPSFSGSSGHTLSYVVTGSAYVAGDITVSWNVADDPTARNNPITGAYVVELGASWIVGSDDVLYLGKYVGSVTGNVLKTNGEVNLPYLIARNGGGNDEGDNSTYTITANDGTYTLSDGVTTYNLAGGFTVQQGATVNWDSSATVTGPIVVESGGALNLQANLNLGSGGSVVADVSANSQDLVYNGHYIIDTTNNNLPVICRDVMIGDVAAVSFGINDTTTANYSAGFEVASGVTVTWRSSGTVNGPIVVNGGTLTLNENLQLGDSGSVTTENGGMINGSGQILDSSGQPIITQNPLTITDVTNVYDNGTNYSGGFTIQNGDVVNWADGSDGGTETSHLVTGQITVNGTLALQANLYLGPGGSVVINGGGSLVPNDGSTYYSVIRTVSPGDSDLTNFTNGFTIPANTTVTWHGAGMVNGAINFADSTSVLSLESDLPLGSNAALTGDTITINGTTEEKTYSLLLNGDQALLPLTLTGDLVIDGLGHYVTLATGDTGSFTTSNNAALTLKNMTCAFSGNAALFAGGANGVNTVTLEDVTLRGASANRQWTFQLFANSSNAQTLTVLGKVCFELPGRVLQLKDAGSNGGLTVTIAADSTLYVGPTVIFEVQDSTDASTSAINMTDASSILFLDGCSVYAGAYGLTLDTGTIIFGHTVRLYNQDYRTPANINTTLYAHAIKIAVPSATVTYLNAARVLPVGYFVVGVLED